MVVLNKKNWCYRAGSDVASVLLSCTCTMSMADHIFWCQPGTTQLTIPVWYNSMSMTLWGWTMVYFTVIKWYGPDNQCFLMAELESGSGSVFLLLLIYYLYSDISRYFEPWSEDVPLVECIHICTLYLHACQVSYHRWLKSVVVLVWHLSTN